MTLSKSNTKQRECVHHWIIDSPHGHMSYGKCRFCGAVTEFSNTLRDAFVRKDIPEIAPGVKVDDAQTSIPD